MSFDNVATEGVLLVDYDGNELREAYVQRMKDEGFDVVLPADDELLVDIDDEAQYAAFQKSWPIFERDIALIFAYAPTYVERPSRSGLPSRHITVRLPFEIHDPMERIAWQGALGSDPCRELLSAIRSTRGDIHPTLFVEAKQ